MDGAKLIPARSAAEHRRLHGDQRRDQILVTSTSLTVSSAARLCGRVVGRLHGNAGTRTTPDLRPSRLLTATATVTATVTPTAPLPPPPPAEVGAAAVDDRSFAGTRFVHPGYDVAHEPITSANRTTSCEMGHDHEFTSNHSPLRAFAGGAAIIAMGTLTACSEEQRRAPRPAVPPVHRPRRRPRRASMAATSRSPDREAGLPTAGAKSRRG